MKSSSFSYLYDFPHAIFHGGDEPVLPWWIIVSWWLWSGLGHLGCRKFLAWNWERFMELFLFCWFGIRNLEKVRIYVWRCEDPTCSFEFLWNFFGVGSLFLLFVLKMKEMVFLARSYLHNFHLYTLRNMQIRPAPKKNNLFLDWLGIVVATRDWRSRQKCWASHRKWDSLCPAGALPAVALMKMVGNALRVVGFLDDIIRCGQVVCFMECNHCKMLDVSITNQMTENFAWLRRTMYLYCIHLTLPGQVSFSPCGEYVFCGDRDKEINVWISRCANGVSRWKFKTNKSFISWTLLQAHPFRPRSFEMMWDGRCKNGKNVAYKKLTTCFLRNLEGFMESKPGKATKYCNCIM